MFLSDARTRSVCKVVKVLGTGNQKRRLLDLGFTPQTKIYVVITAPFGGTVLVGLRGFLVALRQDAAAMIETAEV